MPDAESFITEVYLMVEGRLAPLLPTIPRRRGPAPALTPAEVITLALLSRLLGFRSTRAFYAYAAHHFRPLFPTMPDRTQYLRQLHRFQALITELALGLADDLVDPGDHAYEVIDSTAVPVRNRCRRGHGWLDDVADIGSSSHWIWYDGVHLLTCAAPNGAVTGWVVTKASVNDRALADGLFASRAGTLASVAASIGIATDEAVPPILSAGRARTGSYLADMGFGGQDCEQRWHDRDGAHLLCRPQPDRTTRTMEAATGRWLDRHRQIIEGVFARFHWAFHLGMDRPHTRTGLLTVIATVVAIHNLTILLNQRHDRPRLAYASLVQW